MYHQIAELSSSNSSQSSELDSLRAQLEDAETDRSSAFDANSDLRINLESVKTELGELHDAQKSSAGLSKELEEKGREVGDLTRKLEERDGLLASREGEIAQLKRNLVDQKTEVCFVFARRLQPQKLT